MSASGTMKRLRGEATVPDSMLGLWRRRSIEIRGGFEDPAKLVLWLQTASGMCDMRFPDDRVDLRHRDCLEACTSDELIALADEPSCSSGITSVDEQATPYPTAVWTDGERGVRFQPIVEFEEPGWFEWREDGSTMIEWAPSGDYEEDWRLEANSRSRMLELQLAAADQQTSLFVAGHHAMLVRDRACPVEKVKLSQLARQRRDDHAALVALLDCELSYATTAATDGDFVIELSTLPFREGQALDLAWLRDITPEQSEVKAPNGQLWQIVSWVQSGDR
jgi:hypothetical protein